MNKVKSFNNDGPHELSDHGKKSTFAGPDEYSDIPEVVGAGQYNDNAKFIQRATDHSKMNSVLKGHITVNEMGDEADDNTDFLGYVNDN